MILPLQIPALELLNGCIGMFRLKTSSASPKAVTHLKKPPEIYVLLPYSHLDPEP